MLKPNPIQESTDSFYGDPTRERRCTPAMIQRYLGKISGPLLDCIDLHIDVPAVPYKELRGKGVSPPDMRGRVLQARARQQARGYYNAHPAPRLLVKLAALDDAGERTLEIAVRRMGLCVSAKHVAEAVRYRSLDRNYWS